MASTALRPSELFSRPGGPTYPFRDDRDQLCWLEALTEEGGRLAIKQQTSGDERVVTPSDFQVRSRVHEYGGQCFCRVANHVYFNNFSDGRIYRQHLHDNTPPVAVSSDSRDRSSYADLHYSKALNVLFAVQESHRLEGEEPKSSLTAFYLNQNTENLPQIIVEGADFYANPCISPSGTQIIWQQWQHPHMPWDESRLVGAEIIVNEGIISIGQAKHIAGEKNQSVCQAGFLRDGEVIFAMDSQSDTDTPENYWNLYRGRDTVITPLTQLCAELGEAHWTFGQRRWVQINDQDLYVVVTKNETDQFLKIDLRTERAQMQQETYARLFQLSYNDNAFLCMASFVDKPAELIEVVASGSSKAQKKQSSWIPPAQVCLPELIRFPTSDGGQAFANFYPASNVDVADSALLVLVHGGPTSRSDRALAPLVQYFCQNGFAVLDVNHRGSTGHGRAYRQKLLGQWGLIDADDIADAVQYTLQTKQLPSERVFIRGGSAGGYAVLRALTRFPQLFSAGACYYGIGNLITLAEITHKFEGHYTDQLIGERYTPETAALPDSRFRSRSPIFDIDKIVSPLILFQGLDDKIVPPPVSREMVETLKQNGVKHEYIEYAGEGHGFRKAETRIDALQREIAFYQTILDL